MSRLRHPLLAVLCIAFACAGTASAGSPEDYGSYTVGVTSMLLTDASRTALAGEGPRELMTEIWYPSTDAAKGQPPADLFSFFRGVDSSVIAGVMKMAFGADFMKVAEDIDIKAVRDVPVAEGRFPLILFSHGNGGMRTQAIWWCEFMASHGYIVAAPDHTSNAGVTIFDGKMITIDPKLRAQSAEARPLDISFLIDHFTRMNQGGDSRFFERVDLEHIGVAGHSFGGYTATRVADLDPRVDAISPWAAVGRERENYDKPLLLLIATEDDTIGAEGNARMRTYYEESTGDKYSVEFVNAGHYSFTEMYRWNPDFGDGTGSGERITNGEAIDYIPMEPAFRLLNGYTHAFFDKYLKGAEGNEDYLTTNHAPEELILKHE